MKTHFISDLHLSTDTPHLIELFHHYLDHHTKHVTRLYILGDLFEYWIGDDFIPSWVNDITEKLSALSNNETQLFFCHGNRDFLLGNEFAQQCGMTILDDYSIVKLDSVSVIASHGDALCIDDHAYIAFRNQVRTKQWQQQFLSQPIQTRKDIVENYRRQSKEATAEKSNDIMDVNLDEVVKQFTSHNLNTMIHGHTHRPNIHNDGQRLRIVLSDWREKGHYFEIENDCGKHIYFNHDKSFEENTTQLK